MPGNQPLVPVDFYYPDESDPGAPGRPAGYPIPEQAKTQPRWIEGGYPGAADPGGDRHLLLVDRDHRLLFELYDLHWDGANAGPAARVPSGRSTPTAGARRAGPAPTPPAWRSSRDSCATTRPTADDPIRHAFRVTVRATNGYVFPASHAAGIDRGRAADGRAPAAQGARRTSPAIPPPLRRIFQAMKTYGLIVADNGSDLYVSGTYDTRWDNDLLNPAFAALKGSDFEVVRLGWQPEDEPPPPPDPEPCVENATTLCLNRERFGVRVEWTDYAGHQGTGRAYPLTTDSGLFWFFSESNLEMLVKVIDGCDFNGRFWIYAAATTDVAYTVTVDGLGDRRNLVAQQHPRARLPRLHRHLRLSPARREPCSGSCPARLPWVLAEEALRAHGSPRSGHPSSGELRKSGA